MATKRSTSIQSNVEAVANALAELEPPKEAGPLTTTERALFDLYVQGKAAQDWFPHELLHVCQLAKLAALFNESKAQLDLEGSVIFNGRGTPVCNPLFTVVDTLIRSQLSLTRSLNLSSASGQKKEVNTEHAKKQKQLKDKLGNRTGLLAVPGSNSTQ